MVAGPKPGRRAINVYELGDREMRTPSKQKNRKYEVSRHFLIAIIINKRRGQMTKLAPTIMIKST